MSFSLAGSFPVPTPVLAALTLGLFVYTVGHLSGTHLNPAITLGALSIGKISFNDAVVYWLVQFLGAALAMWVGTQFGSEAMLTGSDDTSILLFEALGAFFFAFGVAAVIYGRVPKDLSGVAVGGSLLIGVSLAALGSSGVLNPAVALANGAFSLSYVLGPVCGAVLGMWVYRLVGNEKR